MVVFKTCISLAIILEADEVSTWSKLPATRHIFIGSCPRSLHSLKSIYEISASVLIPIAYVVGDTLPTYSSKLTFRNNEVKTEPRATIFTMSTRHSNLCTILESCHLEWELDICCNIKLICLESCRIVRINLSSTSKVEYQSRFILSIIVSQSSNTLIATSL